MRNGPASELSENAACLKELKDICNAAFIEADLRCEEIFSAAETKVKLLFLVPSAE